MQKYQDVVLDTYGNAVASASVTVYETGTTTKATIYSDNGVTVTTNPLTTNSLGKFSFWAADGTYDLSVSKTGISTQSLDSIILFDNAASTGAAGVGFLQSGSGAVARTAQAKLREIQVTPQDFGTISGTSGDEVAIQAAEDYLSGVGGGTLVFPCATYAISNTISKKEGVRWLGQGIIDPDGASTCALLKLAANADCKLLETPTGNSGSINDAIQYVGIENMVFDGNVDNQTRSTEYTLVDFRGVYFPGYLKRLLIHSCYGPGLDTGTGGDVRLEDIWILNPVTDSYGWRHNNGYATNQGEISCDEVAVEYIHKATGYTAGDNAATLKADATKRGKGIYLGNPEKFVASSRGLHVEGAQPCITTSGGIFYDLGRVTATYFGDDTNADIIKISSAPQSINVDYVRGQNASSGTTNLIEASGAGSTFPTFAYTSGLPALMGYRVVNPSYGKNVAGRLVEQTTAVASANNMTLKSYGSYFTITGTTTINLIDTTYFNGGDRVFLKFNGVTTVKHNLAHSGTYDTIFLKSGADLTTASGTTLQLVLDTADNRWYEF